MSDVVQINKGEVPRAHLASAADGKYYVFIQYIIR
jgi:hypothetical protein